MKRSRAVKIKFYRESQRRIQDSWNIQGGALYDCGGGGAIDDCGEDLSNILENLKHDLKILLKWFRINSLQANPGKFQFMILGNKKRNSIKLIIDTTETEVEKQFYQVSQLITF